jgi:hypothetical protein
MAFNGSRRMLTTLIWQSLLIFSPFLSPWHFSQALRISPGFRNNQPRRRVTVLVLLMIWVWVW